MRREMADLIGSGLLFAALLSATFAVLAPATGAGTAFSGAGSAVGAELIERGHLLFYVKGCVACHQMAGVVSNMTVGPDLTGLAERAGDRRPGLSAQAYVRESIRTPGAFTVPGYHEGAMADLGLRDDEIDALVAFLLSSP